MHPHSNGCSPAQGAFSKAAPGSNTTASLTFQKAELQWCSAQGTQPAQPQARPAGVHRMVSARKKRGPKQVFQQQQQCYSLEGMQQCTFPGGLSPITLGAGQGCKEESLPGDGWGATEPPVPPRPSTRKRKQTALERGIFFPLRDQQDSKVFVCINTRMETEECW